MSKAKRKTALAGFVFDFNRYAAEAARRVGRASGWATQLTQRYNQDGETAVADRRDNQRKTGKPPTVSAELALKLEAALHTAVPDGGVWSANKVAAWIEQEMRRRLRQSSAWRVLGALGFTLQTVRPQHQQTAPEEEKEEFRKN